MSEIGISSVDIDFDNFKMVDQAPLNEAPFYQHIFAGQEESRPTPKASILQEGSLLNNKVTSVVRVNEEGMLSYGTSAEGRVTISWGDDKGVEISGSASGRVSDDKGNYAEVEAKVDSNGNGEVSAKAGHTED